MTDDLDRMALEALSICEEKGWDRTWPHGGCYLHLEVSEFIEALRGKGDTSPVEEAADVLFVLLSTCAHHGISMKRVVKELEAKMQRNLR